MIALIDHVSHNAATRYASFIRSLRGELSHVMSLLNPGSPSARRQFTINGYRLLNEHIEEIAKLLTQGFDEVLTDALDNALAGEAVNDDLSKSLTAIIDSDPNSHALAALKSLMVKDIEYGAQQLRRLAFDIIAMMSDTSLNNAIHGAVVKSIVGRHSYTQKNNKEWPTIRKAHLLIRYHLLRTHNEAVLLIGMSKGERQFVVMNEARGHRYHGLEFTVDSGADLPWYHDIEATVFHPNSKSLVARRVS